MSELGINATSPVDLLAKAKEIVCRHKELQAKASKLQIQVGNLEQEQNNLVLQRQQEITEKYACQEGADLSPTAAQEYILKEISSTLAQRKKLHNQVSRLEGELLSLEKSNEERKQAQAIMSRTQSGPAKLRKSREYRTRSQDWPDVPDIAKIEEQNPEILAQKILETGRKIEASKMSSSNSKNNHSSGNNGMKHPYPSSQRGVVRNCMPAPLPNPKRTKPNNFSNQRLQEPPKIANFEDRLKSIITSVLNEDQQNRAAKSQASGQTYSPTGSHHFPANNQSTNPSQGYNYNNYPVKSEEKPKFAKYPRCETVVRPTEETRPYPHQEGLASMVECYREPEVVPHVSPQIARQVSVEQADYTQVSPAKLALRRHLSQEKVAAQHYSNYTPQESLVATRTIGDLMSGEIERTLEISNQSIINAAVDMSDIQGTATLTSRSVVNANLPPRPERVNVKAPNPEQSKDEPTARQVYSPISRPSSAEGLEGLAYMHPHVKVNNHGFVAPSSASPRQPQYSPRTTVLYPSSQARNGPNSYPNEQYTPLPRADIKPYHESYFTDVKPPVVNMDANSRGNFVPEGLAASLQARVLNGPHIKEEVDAYDRRAYLPTSMLPAIPTYPADQSIKTENVTSECQFKRESPVIQGPVRKKLSGNRQEGETHSNTSTPLVDEVQDPRSRRNHDAGEC